MSAPRVISTTAWVIGKHSHVVHVPRHRTAGPTSYKCCIPMSLHKTPIHRTLKLTSVTARVAAVLCPFALPFLFATRAMATMQQCSTSGRIPTIYVAHGGGPMPLLGATSQASLTAHLKTVPRSLPKPKAIIAITAHWEVGAAEAYQRGAAEAYH